MTVEAGGEYVVADLYLASYLKARGLELSAVRRDGRRSMFVFRDAPPRRKMVSDFYNDVPVGIGAFTHAIQDLKSAIHNWDGTPRQTDGNAR